MKFSRMFFLRTLNFPPRAWANRHRRWWRHDHSLHVAPHECV